MVIHAVIPTKWWQVFYSVDGSLAPEPEYRIKGHYRTLITNAGGTVQDILMNVNKGIMVALIDFPDDRDAVKFKLEYL